MNKKKLFTAIVMGSLTFLVIKQNLQDMPLNFVWGLSAGMLLPLARYNRWRWRFLGSSLLMGIGASTGSAMFIYWAREADRAFGLFALLTFVMVGLAVLIARSGKGERS